MKLNGLAGSGSETKQHKAANSYAIIEKNKIGTQLQSYDGSKDPLSGDPRFACFVFASVFIGGHVVFQISKSPRASLWNRM